MSSVPAAAGHSHKLLAIGVAGILVIAAALGFYFLRGRADTRKVEFHRGAAFRQCDL